MRPAGYFLVSRIGVLFAVLVVKWLFPAFNGLNALGAGWDGTWYIRIARYGYPHRLVNEGTGSRWAFLPAFPGSIRASAEVTRLPYPSAALLVGSLFGLASAVAIWLAVREIFGPMTADRSVILYVSFPTAFVLNMAYTEGLFIASSALCLYALSRRWWITGSIFAVIGSLTRSFGVVLIIAVVVAALAASRQDERARPLVAVLLAPFGLVGWMIFSWTEVGTPIAFIRAEGFWGGGHFIWFTAPFASLGHLMTGVHAWKVAPDVLASMALLFLFVGLVLMVWAQHDRVRIPPAWWALSITGALAAISPFWPGAILRYTMAVFPLFAAIAWKVRSNWFSSLVAASALMEGGLTIMLLAGVVHPQATLLSP